MAILITGASGAGKTTLALRLKMLGKTVCHLDDTRAWQEYRSQYRYFWSLSVPWDEKRATAQSIACKAALAEGLLSGAQIVEGAQCLPFLELLKSQLTLLVDTHKEQCIAQFVRRTAAKKRAEGELIDNLWLNEKFNRTRQVYELWEPHIIKARTLGHVVCLQSGEVDAAHCLIASA